MVNLDRTELIRRWREFVEMAERGYPLGLEDYRNDLDLRAMIERAGTPDEEVRSLDQRFRRLLVATDRRVWESAPGNPFWDFGYPANSGEELKEGLREEGLLQT